MKKLSRFIFIFFILFILYLLGMYFHDKNRQFIRIATASISGIYYNVGTNICSFVKKLRIEEQNNMYCDIQSTPGSLYNLNTLKSGYVNVVMAQNDWAVDLFNSNDLNYKIDNLRLIASLQQESFILLVRGDSDIKSFRDIENHVINHGMPGTGVRKILDVIFKYLNWDLNKNFSLVTQLRSVEQVQALCDGKIDMMVDFIANPNGMVQEAITTCNARLIPVDEDIIDHLVNDYPYYTRFDILKDVYNNSLSIPTIGIRAGLYALDTLSEDMVYILLKSMVQNIDALRLIHPVFDEFSIQSFYPKGAMNIVPLHHGAEKFYKEYLD